MATKRKDTLNELTKRAIDRENEIIENKKKPFSDYEEILKCIK